MAFLIGHDGPLPVQLAPDRAVVGLMARNRGLRNVGAVATIACVLETNGNSSWWISFEVLPRRRLHDDTRHDTTSVSLLVRVRDPADEQSWREFESRYSDLIFGYCRNRGLQAADTEDVRQAIWLSLSKGLRNFEYDPARGRFRSYLGRVVRNAISRHFARYASASTALDKSVLSAVPTGDSEADEVWEQEWVSHHYRRAMRTIESTFEVRSVSIFTRLLAGERSGDLAVEYGVSAAAINQVKHRIRERMKELIAAQILEEDDPESYGKRRTEPD